MKINYKKLLNFDPTNKDGLIMFCLYISILMFLFNKYIIGMIFGSTSLFLYFSSKEPEKELCRESTIDNPYGNTLWENDNLTSCNTDKKIIKDNFENNLYRNESDLFDKKSMQGLYFNVEQKFPNNIKPFLELLDSNLRCKDENVNCQFPSFF